MATQPSHSIELISQAEAANELVLLVQRAQTVTNASGAAIAVGGDNRQEFFCRASCGPNAPDVGTTVRVDGTLVGTCIKSGEALLCDDSETDTRVDSGAARAMGIRSMLVIPITEEAQVSGVLAVFAIKPYAFSSAHVAALKVLGHQISAVLREEETTIAKNRIEPVRPIPVAPQMVTNTTADADIGEGLSQTFEEALVRSSGTSKASQHSLEVIDAISATRVKAGWNKVIVIGAIATLLAVAVVAVMLPKRGSDGSSASGHTSQPEQHDLAPSQPGVVSESAPPASVITQTKQQKVENKESRLGNQEEEKPQKPTAVSIANDKISGAQLTTRAEPKSDDVAPNLSIGYSSASDLTLLARPANRMPLATTSHSGVVQAKLIHVVDPVYPNIAKTSRISGAVVLQIVVGKDGKVTNPKFIKGPIVLRDAAFTAVQQWRFQPAMLHDQPIEQETRVTVNFRP